MDIKEEERETEAKDLFGEKESDSSQVVQENKVMETGVQQFQSSFRRPSFRR